jgi:hypothetical protein
MNCVASTYDASGKLVGCDEQALNTIISVQLYTMFALGTGLYVYKSFTAENWADIAINIGWGCVSAFTHTKRAFTKYALPGINAGLQRLSDVCASFELLREEGSDSDSAVSPDDYYSIRVIKDGVETKLYSSVFSFVQDIDDNFTEPSCPRRNRTDSDIIDADGDVINVHISEGNASEEPLRSQSEVEGGETMTACAGETTADAGETMAGETMAGETMAGEYDSDDGSDDDSDGSDEDISEVIKRIESHTMQFDFMLSEIPTMQSILNADEATNQTAKTEGTHVMKYDGFPREPSGMHFYDRKFVPSEHRMMEIVLQYEGNEHDLNLASPDNFYVVGNKLLDPAFLKWFMLKNHGVRMTTNCSGSDGPKTNYVVKCLDHLAVLHTLHPHNYLYVSDSGFEVHDSGLV